MLEQQSITITLGNICGLQWQASYCIFNVCICYRQFGVLDYTVVSRIYAPFATLMLVESVEGACMRDLTFYPANTPFFRCHA